MYYWRYGDWVVGHKLPVTEGSDRIGPFTRE